MWSVRYLLLVTFLGMKVICNPVTHPVANLNSDIREYSVKEDVDNVTNVKTLQKETIERYAGFAPIMKPSIRLKEIPDNAISSSSYGRGLVHHGGYGLADYDDSHTYGYAYDYPTIDHDHHGLHDHHGHHGHGHHGHHGHHGLHHHKFHDPALAAKAVLWPIAGIALLGAAAALVSNPVLLQLGVISGRKRRDTDDVTGPDYAINFSKIAKKITVNDGEDVVKIKDGINEKTVDEHSIKGGNVEETNSGSTKDNVNRKLPKRLFRKPKRGALSTTDKTAIDTPDGQVDNRYYQEDRFVPIRLKVKSN